MVLWCVSVGIVFRCFHRICMWFGMMIRILTDIGKGLGGTCNLLYMWFITSTYVLVFSVDYLEFHIWGLISGFHAEEQECLSGILLTSKSLLCMFINVTSSIVL